MKTTKDSRVSDLCFRSFSNVINLSLLKIKNSNTVLIVAHLNTLENTLDGKLLQSKIIITYITILIIQKKH